MFLLMVRGEEINISPLIIRGEIRKRIPRFHPACIHTDAARVLCNGRSRPSLHIGGQLQGGDWLRFRQKPLAASGGFSLVSFPGSVLFNAFSNRCYYTTMICPCQGDISTFLLFVISFDVCVILYLFKKIPAAKSSRNLLISRAQSSFRGVLLVESNWPSFVYQSVVPVLLAS